MNEPRKGPEPLAEILSRLFATRGWGRRQDRLRLERAWATAAATDARIMPHTRLGAFRRGVLEVEVNDSILYQELAQFHKRALLRKMRELLPGVQITDLRFRSGNWTSEQPGG